MSYAVALIMVYVLAWVIDALAPSFGGEKNLVRVLQLVAYSFTAAWLGGIFICCNLGGLISLAATIYSIYTFYLGAPSQEVLRGEGRRVHDRGRDRAIVLGAVLSWVLFAAVGGGMYPTACS